MNRNICCPTKYGPFVHPMEKERWVHFFDVPPSPIHSFLASLIADYNPNHKLFIQLQILMNFSRMPGLTMLH